MNYVFYCTLQISKWLGNGKQLNIVLRLCGTTPDSSNVFGVMGSMVKQIIELSGLQHEYTQLPDDFSELQEVFVEVLDRIPTDRKFIIIVDSLDQLSGKENTEEIMWLPRRLPNHVKMIVSVIGDDFSVRRNIGSKRPLLSENQYIEVSSIDRSTGISVLKMWLKGAGRCLSQQQEKIVEQLMDQAVSLLYIKLVFDEIKRWKSFENPVFDCSTVPSCLQRLYRRLETKHGAVIVSKAFGYLTASQNGLTELEMEDILSIDDEVLSDVFQFHVPPIRRLPSILWARIRGDMLDYIVDRGADGVKVMSWYHRQLLEEARKRYIPTKTTRLSLNTKPLTTTKNYRIYKNLAEYFAGVWANDKEKPFIYTEFQQKRLGISNPEASAVRYISDQPTIFGSGMTVVDKKDLGVNRRKLSELPQACLTVLKHEDITHFVAEHVALNQSFLGAWISLTRWEEISDFFIEITEEHQHLEKSYVIQNQIRSTLAKHVAQREEQDDQVIELINDSTFGKVLQISAVYHCLLLSYRKIQQNPNMIGTDITGRLLPFRKVADRIAEWVMHTDGPGRKVSALVPPHVQLKTPGDELQFIVDVHDGPIQEVQYYRYSMNHHLLSTSRKFVLMSLEDGRIYIDVTPASLSKNDALNKVVVGQQWRSNLYFVNSKDKPHVYVFSDTGKELVVLNIASYSDSQVEISDMKVIEENSKSKLFVVDCHRSTIFIFSGFDKTPVKPTCDVLQCGGVSRDDAKVNVTNIPNRIVQMLVHPDNNKILLIKDSGILELYNTQKHMLATQSFEWWPIKTVKHVIGTFGNLVFVVAFDNGQFCMVNWNSEKKNLKHLQPKYLLGNNKMKHHISYGVPHHMCSMEKHQDANDVVSIACTNKYLIGFTSVKNTHDSSSSEEEADGDFSSAETDRLNLLFRIKENFTVATISKYRKHLLASKGDQIYIFRVSNSKHNTITSFNFPL